MVYEELKRIGLEASNLNHVLLRDRNMDVLLYLAKYNPNVTIDYIRRKLGEDSVAGLEDLKRFNLVIEEKGSLSLTEEGIFQGGGLLTLMTR